MRWFRLKKRPYTPPTDPAALRQAKAHVANERRAVNRRWHTVREIVEPLRERSDRNGFVEDILAARERHR